MNNGSERANFDGYPRRRVRPFCISTGQTMASPFRELGRCVQKIFRVFLTLRLPTIRDFMAKSARLPGDVKSIHLLNIDFPSFAFRWQELNKAAVFEDYFSTLGFFDGAGVEDYVQLST